MNECVCFLCHTWGRRSVGVATGTGINFRRTEALPHFAARVDVNRRFDMIRPKYKIMASLLSGCVVLALSELGNRRVLRREGLDSQHALCRSRRKEHPALPTCPDSEAESVETAAPAHGTFPAAKNLFTRMASVRRQGRNRSKLRRCTRRRCRQRDISPLPWMPGVLVPHATCSSSHTA